MGNGDVTLITYRRLCEMKTNGSIALAVAVSTLFLIGCSQSSSSKSNNNDSTSKTLVTGTVAVGYLENAKVCLDTNDNKQCDEDEPTGYTDSYGVYEFEADADDVATYNVIVEITTETTDTSLITSENPDGYVTNPYVLTSPVGENDFISPITTLVQNELDTDPNTDLEEAEQEIADALDIDVEDIYTDYNDDSELETVQEVSEAIVNTIGDALEDFEETDAYTGENIEEIITIATETAADNLEEIIEAVEEAQSDNEVTVEEINDIADSFSDDIEATAADLEDEIEQQELAEEAESVTPKSVFDEGIFSLEFSTELAGSYYSYSSSYNESDLIAKAICSKTWDDSSVLNDHACEDGILGTTISSTSDATAWVLEGDLFTEITFDTVSIQSEWQSDNSFVRTTEYLLDDSIIYSGSSTLELGVSEISLQGINIAAFMTSKLDPETEDSSNLYFALEGDTDTLYYASTSMLSESFSESAYAYWYSYQTEIPSYNLNSANLFDGSNNEVSGTYSLDTLINDNLYVQIECFSSWADDNLCYLNLNSNEGDLTGSASLYLFDSDYSLIAEDIDWERTTRYGREGVIFSTDAMSQYSYLEAIFDFETDSLVAYENYGENAVTYGTTINFNEDATTEMVAVVDDAITNFVANISDYTTGYDDGFYDGQNTLPNAINEGTTPDDASDYYLYGYSEGYTIGVFLYNIENTASPYNTGYLMGEYSGQQNAENGASYDATSLSTALNALLSSTEFDVIPDEDIESFKEGYLEGFEVGYFSD